MLRRVAGKEVVDAEDLVAALQESLGEMRPEETCSTGNENALFKMLHCGPLPLTSAVLEWQAQSNCLESRCLPCGSHSPAVAVFPARKEFNSSADSL